MMTNKPKVGIKLLIVHENIRKNPRVMYFYESQDSRFQGKIPDSIWDSKRLVQDSWPADKIHVIFKNFKIQYTVDQNNRLLALFTKRTALLLLYQCV